jgi:glycosyltransferase involved in cell wall biosynthesis
MASLRPEVLFFVPYAGPLVAARAGIADAGATGGAETQLFLIAEALHRRGRRVALAVGSVPAELPSVVDGIEIVRLPPFGPGGRNFLRFALATARGVDADVIVQRAAGSFTGLVGAPARMRGRRFVYSTASDLDFDPDLLRDGRSIIAPRLFRLGVRCANAIVVQTDAQAELCRTRWRRRCTVIRSIAEPAPQRLAELDAFLWIGRMQTNKRPEAVVELADQLPHVRFRMVVAGSGSEGALDRSVRERAGTLPNLELLGPQRRDALGPMFERAVAILSTSHAEGMPNVLLEGWARGVPALVLSHDPDGLIRRCELGWSAEGSAQRLAELTAAAWDSRNDQAELAARCRAYVAAEHAPDRIAARWDAVLALSASDG